MSHYISMDSTPAGGAARDPFYVVKDNMQGVIRQLQIDFDKWKDLSETSNTATNPTFKSKTTAIKTAVKKLKGDLTDLSKTIKIVEENRARFTDIDDAELAKRKQFIADTKATLSKVVDTMNSTSTKQKQLADQSRPSGSSFEEKQRTRDESNYVEDRRAQHEQLVEQQDLVITDIESALKTLGDAAITIDTELTTQNDLLENFKEEIDDTQGDMDNVNKKIEKLLGTSDKGKLLCILFLFIIVVILFFVLIYG